MGMSCCCKGDGAGGNWSSFSRGEGHRHPVAGKEGWNQKREKVSFFLKLVVPEFAVGGGGLDSFLLREKVCASFAVKERNPEKGLFTENRLL